MSATPGAPTPITVVGIGADGWGGLPEAARHVLRTAEVIMGSRRQLDLLTWDVPGERLTWPSPLLPALPSLFEAHRDRRIAVLASGDPMFFGIGTTLVKHFGVERVRVLPHPSSVSLACARLGWPVEETDVISLVGRPLELLNAVLQPGRRVLVLGGNPSAVAALLADRGSMTVLSSLGGPHESRSMNAHGLHVIAVEVGDGPWLSLAPGLPDDAYDHDGQLTKREIRAVTVARLAPAPGQLLWDVGAGAGSVGIEWMRMHRSCRAVAVESSAERVARIAVNAAALGVPTLSVVHGSAPEALASLDAPDAVFVGGGATTEGVLDACWSALRSGGRLVVNAVTVDSETMVAAWHGRLGGDLTRIAVQRAAPIGGFTGWRPAMPVTQWAVTKA
jgi:precorrin-6B C5,15-methyltransferase / cobalt-precorrin-6B C5,C15-methyltransferase